MKIQYEDDLEEIRKSKKIITDFLETIRFANLPKDLEREEMRKAKEKLEELQFYEEELLCS